MIDDMAIRIVTEVTDDLTGEALTTRDEPVSFALDGREYEIDLSASNAETLREVLAPYMSAGRMAGRGERASPDAPPRDVPVDVVRAWAASNGFKVNARGRIPSALQQTYAAAHTL